MEYKKTLNMPKSGFPMRAGLPKREPEMLKHCIQNGGIQELIDYANDKGGSDNITAVVLYRK